MTQKGRKVQKMEPRKYWDSPLCLFLPSESEDATQLGNEYVGCKLYITFFVHARESVIFLLNYKTKPTCSLNF